MYNVITVKANIVRIGNSKGVRIPKVMLEESGLNGEVELKLKNNTIVISPIKTSRSGYNDELVLSRSALSDWNDPSEDSAWATLQ